MQVWQALGITDELDLLPVDAYDWFGADGEAILRMRHPGLGPSGWEPGYLFYQPTLERALDQCVLSLPTATVHCGWSAESLEAFDDHVEVTLRRVREPRVGELEPTDETRTVRARYVIGADGANSFVRARRRDRVRRPGLRRAVARRRHTPRRRRRAQLDPRAVPVVRPGPPAHAHAQRPLSPALRVHAAARRASGGLRRGRARVVAARAMVHARGRNAGAQRGLRVPRAAGGDDARRSRAAGGRRGAHDAAVHGSGPVLRRSRRRERRLAAGPDPARAWPRTSCSTATRPSAARRTSGS